MIEIVLPAGPPAAVLVYTLAPGKLAGWATAPSGAAAEFLLPEQAALSAFGRVTGQGGDANMEVVLQARPDIIIDVGTVNPSYVDQANRVQEQTGIPYILIDGSFQKSGETYRMLGDLLGEEARAKLLASYADETLAQLAATLESVPADQRPTAYYGRGDEGLETGLSGSMSRSWRPPERAMLPPPPARAGSPTCRSSRFWPGTPMSSSPPAAASPTRL
jgi:iron complex transport system substrate-binding protein